MFAARPDRLQNRLLALALFLDGLNWLMLVSRVAAETSDVATASIRTQWYFLVGTIFAYLAFLGTLESPLTRPLRGRAAQVAAGAAAVALAGAFLARPDWVIPSELVPVPGPWRVDPLEVGPAGPPVLLLSALVLVFAVVAALHAWVRTPRGTAARSRTGWYVAAFAVRDFVLLVDWIRRSRCRGNVHAPATDHPAMRLLLALALLAPVTTATSICDPAAAACATDEAWGDGCGRTAASADVAVAHVDAEGARTCDGAWEYVELYETDPQGGLGLRWEDYDDGDGTSYREVIVQRHPRYASWHEDAASCDVTFSVAGVRQAACPAGGPPAPPPVAWGHLVP